MYTSSSGLCVLLSTTTKPCVAQSGAVPRLCSLSLTGESSRCAWFKTRSAGRACVHPLPKSGHCCLLSVRFHFFTALIATDLRYPLHPPSAPTPPRCGSVQSQPLRSSSLLFARQSHPPLPWRINGQSNDGRRFWFSHTRTNTHNRTRTQTHTRPHRCTAGLWIMYMLN